jgi:hypothetical protein
MLKMFKRALSEKEIKKMYEKQCGGNNSYDSTKIGNKSDGEMTATIRTNIQEIANSNEKLEMFGYMFGKWLTKRSSIYFLTGLSKALMEK